MDTTTMTTARGERPWDVYSIDSFIHFSTFQTTLTVATTIGSHLQQINKAIGNNNFNLR
jgi:hypothetical protein